MGTGKLLGKLNEIQGGWGGGEGRVTFGEVICQPG